MFGKFDVSDFKMDVGIVVTNCETQRAMIFKTNKDYAHGRTGTFMPWFGCTIADAIQATCSAYPVFQKYRIRTADGRLIDLMDGGYSANNPTLYAIADAASRHDHIKVVSIGVGVYPRPSPLKALRIGRLLRMLVKYYPGFQLFESVRNVNARSMEQLQEILFKDIQTVRINNEFSNADMATDFTDFDLRTTELLYGAGRESFAAYEGKLREIIGVGSENLGG
jgi:predicted acylesterase/phospholipase RssA